MKRNYLISVAAYLTAWLIGQVVQDRILRHVVKDGRADVTRKLAAALADEMELRAVERERDLMSAGSIH